MFLQILSLKRLKCCWSCWFPWPQITLIVETALNVRTIPYRAAVKNSLGNKVDLHFYRNGWCQSTLYFNLFLHINVISEYYSLKVDNNLLTNEIAKIFFIKYLSEMKFRYVLISRLKRFRIFFFAREARELAGPGLRSELITMRSNISSLEEAFLSISSILERVVRRSVEETSDLAGMSRELASLSNNTVLSLLDDEAESNTPDQDRHTFFPCKSIFM